jgi:hypothetical protein
MKRIFLMLFICSSIVTFAEVVTMDLATATDMASNPVTYGAAYGLGYYDGTDVWDSTYNDSGICQFIYTNEARFMLSHMPSLNSYGGMSWEGFTLSKVSQDTANVFGCVADGGLAGVGTPYVIGYFSEWVTKAQGFSSNIILFDQEYYPEYVYICQNSNTMEAIANGGVFNARVFTAQDTLTLIISGLTTTLEETQSVMYYLAVDGEMNNGWVKVPLTALGKVGGLSFRMTTTDMGDFGANTPMYFAMDGLTVNTELPTNVSELHVVDSINQGRIVMRGSQLMILMGNELYTLLGQRLK